MLAAASDRQWCGDCALLLIVCLSAFCLAFCACVVAFTLRLRAFCFLLWRATVSCSISSNGLTARWECQSAVSLWWHHFTLTWRGWRWCRGCSTDCNDNGPILLQMEGRYDPNTITRLSLPAIFPFQEKVLEPGNTLKEPPPGRVAVVLRYYCHTANLSLFASRSGQPRAGPEQINMKTRRVIWSPVRSRVNLNGNSRGTQRRCLRRYDEIRLQADCLLDMQSRESRFQSCHLQAPV